MNDNKLKLLPCGYYDKLDSSNLRIFCHIYARYGLPTVELIDFLKPYLQNQKTIEIGAGSGDLGHHLNVTMTDNYNQEMPDVKAYYDACKQPVIKYGTDVEKLEALEAVDKHKPDVVVGCWVTHWIDPNLPPPIGGGNIYGIKEEEVIKRVKTYILIGAKEIHKHKTIMNIPHKEIEAPFVRSRRKDNFIWIWNNRKFL